MTRPEETSVVEDVGNREQGNIQTHGESKNSGKGATKGRYKSKNTHTMKKQYISTSKDDTEENQRSWSSKNGEARIANRQKGLASGVCEPGITRRDFGTAVTWTV